MLLDVHLKPDEELEGPVAVCLRVPVRGTSLCAKQHDSARLGADVGDLEASVAIVKGDGGLDLLAVVSKPWAAGPANHAAVAGLYLSARGLLVSPSRR